ncbi:CapA family protein [Intrasporangium sp. YIM S08009]|uniref:CapA family protein n=1 Tax=Intrasporangium zincisolvens TaxID=3080018 RepID=UPI002B0532AE|nr:CapA family protein [Intrasporangium sp. YIM S08009]
MGRAGALRTAAVAFVAALAACSGQTPSGRPAPGSVPPESGAATPSAPTRPAATGRTPLTPTTGPGLPSAPEPPVTTGPGGVPASFPLAVVTGLQNLKATVTLDELRSLAARGSLVVPCGVTVSRPVMSPRGPCTDAARIVDVVRAAPGRVALLPPGLVEPATKVLSIAGPGPYGMFGPDLFGDKAARALRYPVSGSATTGASSASGALDPRWTAYDASTVWTMTNLGSLCSDRGAATQAVARGRGWDWVFEGGTARYARPAVVDPPYERPYRTVQPVDTGNRGATPRVVRQSDVAIADHECPIVADRDYTPQLGTTTVFSVPEAVLPRWRDTLGLDVVYLAANHMSDKGVRGIRSTLRLMDQYHIPRTGLGMDLDEALRPAFVDVAGLRVGFVAVNDVAGVARADRTTPGVPWITRANIVEGVKRARAGGAHLVVCNPQWWGGAEYHDDLWPLQQKQVRWFAQAGCDHVIGSGTHVAGPLLLGRRAAGGVGVVLSSPGNYLFGQGWWQETQEGIILDLSFRGTTLVNVRMRPTVMIRQARPALLDPQGDGRYVLQRVLKYSSVDYRR